MGLTDEQAEKIAGTPDFQLTAKTILQIASVEAVQDALITRDARLPLGHHFTLCQLPGFTLQDLALRRSIDATDQLLGSIRELKDEIYLLRMGVSSPGLLPASTPPAKA